LQLKRRAADGLEHIASSGLLLKRFITLASKSGQLRFLAGGRGTAPRYSLGIAALWPRRLAVFRFGLRAACFGTPFHELPEGFG
jgi:hypothetical protein